MCKAGGHVTPDLPLQAEADPAPGTAQAWGAQLADARHGAPGPSHSRSSPRIAGPPCPLHPASRTYAPSRRPGKRPPPQACNEHGNPRERLGPCRTIHVAATRSRDSPRGPHPGRQQPPARLAAGCVGPPPCTCHDPRRGARASCVRGRRRK